MTQQAQAEALKPCPFCGKSHAARVVPASEMWDVESEGPFPYSETYSVICDASTDSDLGGCGSSGGYFETSHEAIAAWNLRAPAKESKPMPVTFPADMTSFNARMAFKAGWQAGEYAHGIQEKRNGAAI